MLGLKELSEVNVTFIRFCVNYVARFIFSGIAVYCCWIAIENNYWFSWHIILCTLGYIPLMAEALMLFSGDDIWNTQISRKTKYIIHGILITFGTIIAICGNSLCFHYLKPGFHLYTVHGITGLISMILCIISLFTGLAAYYAQDLKIYVRPVCFKFNHNIIGIIGYIVGIISLCFGYYTDWFIRNTTEESRIVVLIATICGSIWSLNTATKSGYSQMQTMLN